MKANKYITPEMRKIELGSRAIAVPVVTSQNVDPFTKKDNAWDDADTDSESEW